MKKVYESEREKLIRSHLHVVEQQVAIIGRRTPPSVSREDLRSTGYVGLIRAADTFNPERGTSFGAYASLKIRGAILDELRRMDHLSRHTRASLRDRDVPARFMQPASLDGANNLEALAVSSAVSSAEDEAVASMELTRMQANVTQLVTALPDRLRMVVEMTMFEDRTLVDVAAALGVTESRACQMRQEAFSRLRLTARSLESRRIERKSTSAVSEEPESRSDEIEQVLARGLQSDSKRIKRAAERVRESLARLVELLEEDSERAAAVAEVARLEAELAAARERLRTKPAKLKAPVAAVNFREVWDWAETQGIQRKRGRPAGELVERYKRAQSDSAAVA